MALGAASPGERQVFVGARKRLSDERRYGYHGELVVSYYDGAANDGDGGYVDVELCADGARSLAKELKTWADMIDPPKKRRRRS